MLWLAFIRSPPTGIQFPALVVSDKRQAAPAPSFVRGGQAAGHAEIGVKATALGRCVSERTPSAPQEHPAHD